MHCAARLGAWVAYLMCVCRRVRSPPPRRIGDEAEVDTPPPKVAKVKDVSRRLTKEEQEARAPKHGGHRRGDMCPNPEKCKQEGTPCVWRCHKYLRAKKT